MIDTHQLDMFAAPPAPAVEWPAGWDRGSEPTSDTRIDRHGRWRLQCVRYTHESGAVVIRSHMWSHRDGAYRGVRCTPLDAHLCGRESADALIAILLREAAP